jgi:hypothetical protein
MLKLVNGSYEVVREVSLPDRCFIKPLTDLTEYITQLINKYGNDAEIIEECYPGGSCGFSIKYIDNATEDEIKSYLKEQEKEQKARLKKESQERVFYEKLKKKYESL